LSLIVKQDIFPNLGILIIIDNYIVSLGAPHAARI
jgi:hypothetical protein